MHELTRRAYLESLGIDSYVSRAQLPGAAPTLRLLVKRSTAPHADRQLSQSDVAPVPTPSRIPVAGASVSPAADISSGIKLDQARSLSPGPDVKSQPPSNTPILTFSVVAVAVGGLLWVEELSHSVLSQNQVHLIRAMARALGCDDDRPQVSQFDWPIHQNTQLDLGDAAAGASLGGFIQRKLEHSKCRGLVLLGNACQARLDMMQLDVPTCVATVSTLDMLGDGEHKKRAWLDLQPFKRHP